MTTLMLSQSERDGLSHYAHAMVLLAARFERLVQQNITDAVAVKFVSEARELVDLIEACRELSEWK